MQVMILKNRMLNSFPKTVRTSEHEDFPKTGFLRIEDLTAEIVRYIISWCDHYFIATIPDDTPMEYVMECWFADFPLMMTCDTFWSKKNVA